MSEARTVGPADIERRVDGQSGMFFIAGDDEPLAEMTFEFVDERTIVILHTGVRDALQGQGVARMLVNAGVAYARDAGLTIRPVCTYAARVLADSQFDDVRAT